MNIIEACRDPKLFRPYFEDEDRITPKDEAFAHWKNWRSILKVLYGLEVKGKSNRELIRRITGRNPRKLPKNGFETALFLTGRRSGKSRIAAVIGAFEAVLGGHEQKLSPGERGIIPIISVSKRQAELVRDYLRALFNTPLLEREVVSETRSGFDLKNGTRIEILAADFRSVRGMTLLCVVLDEVAYMGYEADHKVRSDTELVRALQPALSTVQGKLIAITSPYARMGWCYKMYKRHFGNDESNVLVVNCPSKTLNLSERKLPQRIIDEAMAEDMASAKSEYLAEFRDDVGLLLPREVVERLVIPGRQELLPDDDKRYFAFCDPSGGRADDASLAIAHREGRKIVLDCLKRYRPPFAPYSVIGEMTQVLKKYNVRRITGDNYAAEFVASAFQAYGITYTQSEKPKSALYLEFLSVVSSNEIELLDDELMIDQIACLERRTRSGGKDIVDHPPGGHDDLANSVAGVGVVASQRVLKAGGFSVRPKVAL